MPGAMTQGAALPLVAPRRAGELAPEYAARVLAYVLEHRITATLSDGDLEMALAVSVQAVCSPDMAPPARERLSEARMLMLRTLDARRAERRQAAASAVAPCRDNQGEGGRTARLVEAPRVGPGGGAPAARVSLSDIF